VVNFKRRGGPEPAWYLHEEWIDEAKDWLDDDEDWSDERGEFDKKVREPSPEKVAEEEAALDAYEKRWNASLDARHALVIHALCDALCAAMETAPRGPGEQTQQTSALPEGTTGLPSGWIPFSVPADVSLYEHEPPVQLAVRWEPNTQEEPPAVSLMIVCSDEVA